MTKDQSLGPFVSNFSELEVETHMSQQSKSKCDCCVTTHGLVNYLHGLEPHCSYGKLL
jgi:hypothetical protein